MRIPAPFTTTSNIDSPRTKADAYRLAFTIEKEFAAARNDTLTAEARQSAARQHLADLRRRLRRERALGKGGHAGYDLSRHLALAQLVKQAERPAPAAPLPVSGRRNQMRMPRPATRQNAPAA